MLDSIHRQRNADIPMQHTQGSIISKTLTTPNVGEDVEQLELSYNISSVEV